MAVEYRSGASESYGKGKKKTMKFKHFIKRFAEGDPHLYLTTQELGLDLEGRPLLMAPPVTHLSRSLSLFSLSLSHTHFMAPPVTRLSWFYLSLSLTHTPGLSLSLPPFLPPSLPHTNLMVTTVTQLSR